MLLGNVSVVGQQGSKNIFIKNGIIQSVRSYETSEEEYEKMHSIFFNNAIAFPGLINSHDHLDFNLFPSLKNKIYNNYTEWGKDIHQNNKNEITKVLSVPKQVRTQFGIYKNLLNGFTTVVNHGEHLKIENDLVNVFQKTYCMHSVGFEKRWRWKLNNPLKNKWPVAMHIGEGKDEVSHDEISKLIQWNIFRKKIVGIHGVAMDYEQAAYFHALVWCPASNYFLLNKTAAIDFLKDKTNILFGSDSTLTSGWNIWEQIRLARKEKMLTDEELFDTLVSKPATVWGLGKIGEIKNEYYADIVIAKKKDRLNDYDAFFLLNPEDILMVIYGGNIQLFDGEIKNQLEKSNIDFRNFSKISLNGREKYVKGNLPELINEVKKYYSEAALPISL